MFNVHAFPPSSSPLLLGSSSVGRPGYNNSMPPARPPPDDDSSPHSSQPSPLSRSAPRRRWFRISLRTMLLLLTLLCIWLGVKVNQARRQKEAIAALRSIHQNVVLYHQQRDGGYPDFAAEHPAPAWLRQITGDDFFQRVRGIGGGNAAFTDEFAPHLSAFDDLTWLRIGDSPASDEVLCQIGDLSSLETVQFIKTPVGDRFMERLASARKLQHLTLDHTRVTDDGLKRLSHLQQLQSVQLINSPIENDGLRGLSNSRNLQALVIADLPIDDEGVEHLPNLSLVTQLELRNVNVTDAGLRNLNTGRALADLNVSGTKIRGTCLPSFCTPALLWLHLTNTPIEDDSLRHLETAASLEVLTLDGTSITDDGLAHLANVPSLWCISLRRTKVTGQGLRHLANLRQLHQLCLGNTKLSREGFELLQALPSAPPRQGFLDLEATPLDDSTIEFLNGLSVAQLFLSKTKITDSGLAKLTNMPNLQRIDLTDTAVTPAGVALLKQRIPSLQHVHTSFDQDAIDSHLPFSGPHTSTQIIHHRACN
jgi:hypothetical protein